MPQDVIDDKTTVARVPEQMLDKFCDGSGNGLVLSGNKQLPQINVDQIEPSHISHNAFH